MMPFITILLLTISLLIFGGQQFASQHNGGNSAMNRTSEVINKDIPPMDLHIPAVTGTATFALG